MARSTRTAAAKPAPPARKSTVAARTPAKKVVAPPVEAPVAKTARRPGKSAPSTPAPAPARKTATAPATPKPLPAPKLSKDELKVLVDKLERSVTTLRAKSRDMTRAAKVSNGRIAELEAEVARLEDVVARAEAAAKPAKPPAKKPRAPRAAKMSPEPGAGVDQTAPPDVAAENQPPSEETAETSSTGAEENPSSHS